MNETANNQREMKMKTTQIKQLADDLAFSFKKVADKNKPAGLTDSWCLFQCRNAWGLFLTPRQCLKVGKLARAAYSLIA